MSPTTSADQSTTISVTTSISPTSSPRSHESTISVTTSVTPTSHVGEKTTVSVTTSVVTSEVFTVTPEVNDSDTATSANESVHVGALERFDSLQLVTQSPHFESALLSDDQSLAFNATLSEEHLFATSDENEAVQPFMHSSLDAGDRNGTHFRHDVSHQNVSHEPHPQDVTPSVEDVTPSVELTQDETSLVHVTVEDVTHLLHDVTREPEELLEDVTPLPDEDVTPSPEGLFLKDVTPAPKLLLDVVTPTPEMIVEHVTPSSVTLSEELLEVVTPSPQPFSDVTPSVQPFSDDVNDETLPAAQSLNDAEKLHSRPVHR